MHVSRRELQGVVQALGFDWAGSAEVACCGYVGDVFVGFGEHLVGFVFAVGLVFPLGYVCIVWICLVWLVVRGHGLRVVMLVMMLLGMHMAWPALWVLMSEVMVVWVSVVVMRYPTVLDGSGCMAAIWV